MPREIRLETIGDLSYTQKLYAGCGACGRSVARSVPALISKYGPLLTLDSVKRRVKCNRECRRVTQARAKALAAR